MHKNKFDNTEIKEAKKRFNELRDNFLGSIIKNVRKKFYKTKKKKSELEKILNKFKKYYDYDDLDYKGIRDIENLFDEITEDYYKPIRTNNTDFNDSCKEYERKGDKYKNLSPEEYFDKIRPYL